MGRFAGLSRPPWLDGDAARVIPAYGRVTGCNRRGQSILPAARGRSRDMPFTRFAPSR
jgi:hypothetical protein